MAHERATARCRRWYARLLRLYPKPYRKRFGDGMQQTFNDLVREQQAVGKGLLRFIIWVFVETSVGIARENMMSLNTQAVTKSIAHAIIGTGALLLIPLMLQLTIGTGVDGQGFNWKPNDFVVMGALIFCAALGLEVAARSIAATRARYVALAAIVLLFLLVWAHLAVGIVDSWPFAGS
jgi:hypothetical protein